MVRLDDHRDADGELNWHAFNRAQVAAGEVCYECGRYNPLAGKGYRAKCPSCEDLDQPAEASHHSYIRCPRCGENWDPRRTDDHHVYRDEDDGHDICCQHCDYEFQIQTRVDYTFTSPERLKGWHKCERCEKWYEEAKGDGYCGLCPKCLKESKDEDEGAPVEAQDNKNGDQGS